MAPIRSRNSGVLPVTWTVSFAEKAGRPAFTEADRYEITINLKAGRFHPCDAPRPHRRSDRMQLC